MRGGGGSVRGHDGVDVRLDHTAHDGRVGGVGQSQRGDVLRVHALVRSHGEHIARTLPEVLATSGLHDPRVAYWEGAKYAARLREATTNDARTLLKTDLDAGHFSATDRYQHIRERAYEHGFVLDSLGLSGAEPEWAPKKKK